MEQNNGYQIFEIICDDKELIIKAIVLYNKAFYTNFELLEYIEVEIEVDFAKIGGNINFAHVFALGNLYGRLEMGSGNS